MSSRKKSKTSNEAISKLIEKSETENEEEEHELYYYVNDRVKLMKEVLKIIKPRKIKSMAPDCIKNVDTEEINSLLLEEVLGISNKRLKYIFNGQNINEDSSSSTDPEEESKIVDLISLDDVSEDEFVIDLDSDTEKTKKKRHKPKQTGETSAKKVKKEKSDKKTSKKENLNEENLMSVLELLELQARARAIKSQLMLEASRKKQEREQQKNNENSVQNEDDDEIIINVPNDNEIVITSSESEDEQNDSSKSNGSKKITLIRNRLQSSCESNQKDVEDTVNNITNAIEVSKHSEENNKNNETSVKEIVASNTENEKENKLEEQKEESVQETTEKDANKEATVLKKDKEAQQNGEKSPGELEDSEGECHDDEIILIVDQDEIDGLIGNQEA